MDTRTIPQPVESDDPPSPPELHVDELESRRLVQVEGRPGHFEWLLPEATAALEAGALVVYAPAPPGVDTGAHGREDRAALRVRVYRWNGPAWYRDYRGTVRWGGRGMWYATAYARGLGSRSRTVNVYLGKWRAPGVRSRAWNAKTSPPPLSPEGVRRAVELLTARIVSS